MTAGGLLGLLASKAGHRVLLIAAAALAVVFVLWRVHAAGRAAERAAVAARNLEIRHDQLDAYVNQRPRGRAAVVERLRDGAF